MNNFLKIVKNKSFITISPDCYNIIKEKNSKSEYSY